MIGDRHPEGVHRTAPSDSILFIGFALTFVAPNLATPDSLQRRESLRHRCSESLCTAVLGPGFGGYTARRRL